MNNKLKTIMICAVTVLTFIGIYALVAYDDAVILSLLIAALILTIYITCIKDYWHSIIHMLVFLTAFTLRLPINLPVGYIYGIDLFIVGVILFMLFKVEKPFEIFKEQKLITAFILFLFFHSIFFAYDKVEAIKGLLTWTKAVILFFFVYKFFPYRNYINYFFKVWNCFLTFELAISLVQKISGKSLGMKILGESEYVFRGSMEGYSAGISGTFGHPAMFAYFTLITLCWALFIIDDISKNTRNILMLLSVIIIVLCASRTVIGLTIILFTIYALMNTKRVLYSKKTAFILMFLIPMGILVAVLSSSIIQPIFERIMSAFMKGSFDNRLIHFSVASEIISKKPILGWGLNNYFPAVNLYYDVSSVRDNDLLFSITNRVHNIFYVFALELGIFGGLFMVLFVYLKRIIEQGVFAIKTNFKRINTIMFGTAVSVFMAMMYGIQGQAGVTPRGMYIIWIGIGFYENYKKFLLENENIKEVL